MFLVYLLWIVVVGGGLFIGLGALRTLVAGGFDFALALNAIIYLGCALYAMPKLWRLLVKKA